MVVGRARGIASLAALVLVLAACSTSPATPTPGASAAPSAEASAQASTPPEASPSPEPSPSLVAKGHGVTVLCGADPCLTVTVVKWSFASKYKGSKAVFDDKPAKGNVFVAVDIRYAATATGAAYHAVDWTVDVNGKAYERAYPVNGPRPEVLNGELAAGKKAEGWVVFEVPSKGRVVLSYMPLQTPVFQVLLRSK
jgi:hypothetical protein